MTENIISWAQKNFNQKLSTREVDLLMKGKHGELYGKMFGVLTKQVVSKKEGKRIREACEVHDAQCHINKLDSEVDELEATNVPYKDQLLRKLDVRDQNEYLEHLLVTLEGIDNRLRNNNVSSESVIKLKNSIDNFRNCLLSGSPERCDEGDLTLSSDDLVKEIDTLVEDINLLLYEFQQVGKRTSLNVKKVEKSTFDALCGHECKTKIVRDLPKSPIALEQCSKVEHSSQAAMDKSKHMSKLKKAKIFLDECQIVLEKAMEKS